MRVFNRSIVEMLGQERLSNVKVIGDNEVEQSMYGQLVLGKGVSSSLEEQLVKEVKKAGKELGNNLAILFFYIRSLHVIALNISSS